MKQTAVWIDHHKAYIFDYEADGIHEKELTPHHHHGKVTKDDLRKFYHELANSLNHTECILLVGPGTAKEEFKHYCEDHHQKIGKAIVKVETMKDHPTHEQILRVSNKFFKQQFSWMGV